jgi:hypothetical protein
MDLRMWLLALDLTRSVRRFRPFPTIFWKSSVSRESPEWGRKLSPVVSHAERKDLQILQAYVCIGRRWAFASDKFSEQRNVLTPSCRSAPLWVGLLVRRCEDWRSYLFGGILLASRSACFWETENFQNHLSINPWVILRNAKLFGQDAKNFNPERRLKPRRYVLQVQKSPKLVCRF